MDTDGYEASYDAYSSSDAVFTTGTLTEDFTEYDELDSPEITNAATAHSLRGAFMRRKRGVFGFAFLTHFKGYNADIQLLPSGWGAFNLAKRSGLSVDVQVYTSPPTATPCLQPAALVHLPVRAQLKIWLGQHRGLLTARAAVNCTHGFLPSIASGLRARRQRFPSSVRSLVWAYFTDCKSKGMSREANEAGACG
ncbi:hypothetical protein BDV98DRAFT_620768 [Pterulicium gracile]|uniref:Uncharacterized protein n=1 Tax=Pterulicium gracile TaxID=1884261 RepID=A0A5C3QS30_9AGAR|nr:hypothetical protein BDV98DRAFT_620768 [Pterula gracilis]